MQKIDEIIIHDNAHYIEQYRQILLAWGAMGESVNVPSFLQWKQAMCIVEANYETASLNEAAALQSIESLIVHLSVSNLAIVRRTPSGNEEIESLQLANHLRKSLRLNIKHNKYLIGLFSYYIKNSEEIFSSDAAGGKYISRQRLTLSLNKLLNEVETKIERGLITKDKSINLIEGATTLMVRAGLSSRAKARAIITMTKEMEPVKVRTGLGDTIAKWAAKISN